MENNIVFKIGLTIILMMSYQNILAFTNSEKFVINSFVSDDSSQNLMAVREVYHQKEKNLKILELLAEKFNAELTNKSANSDLLSWYAKALGTSGHPEFYSIIKAALENTDDPKQIKYYNYSLEQLGSEGEKVYVPNVEHYNSLLGEYKNIIQNDITIEKKSTQILELKTGITGEEILSALGFPDQYYDEYVSVQLRFGPPANSRTQRRIYVYNDVGVMQLERKKHENNIWRVLTIMPYPKALFEKNQKLSDDELLEKEIVLGLWNWNYNKIIATYRNILEKELTENQLDLIVQRMWYSRGERSSSVVKGMRYLSTLIKKSKNPRYYQVISKISRTSNASPALRKGCKKIAKSLKKMDKESKVTQFVPS